MASVEEQTNVVGKGLSSLEAVRFYLITDKKRLPTGTFFEALESALKGGARSIQLREKDLAPDCLRGLAKKVKVLTNQYGASLFINSHADIAGEVGAEGVHLTELGPSAREIRRRYPQLLIGVSTHSLEGVREAKEQGADFVTFGPVFETPSKKKYGPPQGLDRLQEISQSVAIPIVALGGIKLDHVTTVLDHGAFGVAMISAVWDSENIEGTTSDFIKSVYRR